MNWEKVKANQRKLSPVLKDLAMDALGGCITAIGIVTFVAKAGFAPGGVSGVALLLHYFFPSLPLGMLNILMNVPIIFFSLRYLGHRYILRSFRTLTVMAIFMDLVVPRFPVYKGNPLLASIFGGALIGIGLAIVFSNASSTAGVDLLVMSMKRMHPQLSVGQITLILDGIIICAGGLVYGNIDAVLYGFIFTFVTSAVIDKLMSGWISGKMALIISEHGAEIARGIDQQIARGSTIVQGKGSYSGQQKEIVLCALTRNQLPKLRSMATEVDAHALIIILEYSSAYGQGFQSLVEANANPGY